MNKRIREIFAAVLRENRTEYQGLIDFDGSEECIRMWFGPDYVDSHKGALTPGVYMYDYGEPLIYIYCDIELTSRETGDKIYLYRLDD